MPQTVIDALIEKLVDQKFVAAAGRMDLVAEQFATQSKEVANSSNQMFVLATQIVNATALNRIPSGTANQILEHNATARQPFNSPTGPDGKTG